MAVNFGTAVLQRCSFSEKHRGPVVQSKCGMAFGWLRGRLFYIATGSSAGNAKTSLLAALTGDGAVRQIDVAGDLQGFDRLDHQVLPTGQQTALSQASIANFHQHQTGAVIAPAAPRRGATDALSAASGWFQVFHPCKVWMGRI